MVSFDVVDQEIGRWQSSLAAASDNLMALYEHPTYKRLDGRTVPLTGATAKLVTPALDAMNELFAQMGQITSVVDRAVKLRQGAGRFAWSDRTPREILSLLLGPSIQLPPVNTPLEQRGLLTSAEQAQAITPERLLSAMTQAFEEAKSAVLAVDAAWERLDPMLSAWDLKLTALAAMAKNLGADAIARVSDVQQQLESCRSLACTDPISAVGNTGISGQLQTSVERLRVQLESLTTERTLLRTRLEKARTTLLEIAGGRERAEAAAMKCRQCIAYPTGLLASVSDAQLAELEDWLNSVADCDRLGHWTALGKGLARWEELASEYSELQTAAVTANEGLIEALAELKGRLSALKMKARAHGLVSRPDVARAEQQASECLCMPLVPIDLATKLVAEFEDQASAA